MNQIRVHFRTLNQNILIFHVDYQVQLTAYELIINYTITPIQMLRRHVVANKDVSYLQSSLTFYLDYVFSYKLFYNASSAIFVSYYPIQSNIIICIVEILTT